MKKPPVQRDHILTARELAMADALRGCQMLPHDWNIGSSIARDVAAGKNLTDRQYYHLIRMTAEYGKQLVMCQHLDQPAVDSARAELAELKKEQANGKA